MTQCTGTPADACLERYLQGTLPEVEAREFEEHFFDCPTCLAQVQSFEAVALHLGAKPFQTPKKPIAWPVRGAWLGAIAAALLVGFVSLRTIRQPAQPTVAVTAPRATEPPASPVQAAAGKAAALAVSRLADLAMPAFRASNLRGESRNLHFSEGMEAYTKNDCAGAIKSLAQVPAQDPDGLAAEFFTGVCQMNQRDLSSAAGTLRTVAAARDSPQQEAALYYLAQLALVREDAPEARKYLGQTIALRGDFEKRGRTELSKLR